MVVLIVLYMEIDKLTGSTLVFGKTLLSASYNFFLTSVLTSMYNPRAPALTAVEHMDLSPCVENDMDEVKEHAKKRKVPLPCTEHGHTTIVTFLKFLLTNF